MPKVSREDSTALGRIVEQFFGFTPQQLTANGLLLLIVLLVVGGLLVPRRTLNDVRADRDARVKELSDERDEWKAAYFASDRTSREAIGQVQALLEVSRTSESALRAIPPRKIEAASDE